MPHTDIINKFRLFCLIKHISRSRERERAQADKLLQGKINLREISLFFGSKKPCPRGGEGGGSVFEWSNALLNCLHCQGGLKLESRCLHSSFAKSHLYRFVDRTVLSMAQELDCQMAEIKHVCKNH